MVRKKEEFRTLSIWGGGGWGGAQRLGVCKNREDSSEGGSIGGNWEKECSQQFCNIAYLMFCNRNSTKRRKPIRKEWEPSATAQEMGSSDPPPPPPPSPMMITSTMINTLVVRPSAINC